MNTDDIRKLCARKKLVETSPNTIRFDVELKREENKIDIQKKRMLGDVLREKEKLLNEFVQINVKTPEIRPFLNPSPIGRSSNYLRLSNHNRKQTISTSNVGNIESKEGHSSENDDEDIHFQRLRRSYSLRRPVQKPPIVVPVADSPIECHSLVNSRDQPFNCERQEFKRSATLKSRTHLLTSSGNGDKQKQELLRTSSEMMKYSQSAHIRSSSGDRQTLNVTNNAEASPFRKNSPVRGSGGARPGTSFCDRQSLSIPIIKLDGSSAVMYPNKSAQTGRRVLLSARVSTRMKKADAIMKNLDVVRSSNGFSRPTKTELVKGLSFDEMKPVYL